MKNYMLFAALAAALTLSSCAKEAQVNESAVARTVHFSALPIELKTIFGDKSDSKYPILWQEGDQICPSVNYATPSSSNYITVTPSADGTSASFEGDIESAETYRFMFISPAATFKSINKTNKTVMAEFPSGQTSTAASPDPAAQILFADTGEMTEIPNPVVLEFTHLTAYLHIQFKNVALDDAQVQAVNIIASDDCVLAGRIFYHWDTDTFEPSTQFNTISVSTSTLSHVWCAVCPVDLSSEQLTIEIVTNKGTFTKNITMPTSANLERGKIGHFTVNMDKISPVLPVVYNAITSVSDLHVGDQVIIAAADDNEAYAMSTGQNTNNRSAAGVTKTAETILNPTDAVEIIELEDGVIPGHFAFKATSTDGYLYAGNQASSGSNILRTKATKDNSASWSVEVKDVTQGGVTWKDATYMFADIPSTGRGLIAFNADGKLFTAYGKGTTQQAIKIYRLDAPVDNTPRFNVTLPNGTSYNCSAQEIPVYVFGNVAWTASVTDGATLSENSGTGNAILTLTVPAVTQDTDYTLTLTTEAAASETEFKFTVQQAIVAGDVLFHEQYWTGSVSGKKVTDYQTSGDATTYVYGGASVVYSQDKSTKFLDWPTNANVFLPSPYSGSLPTEGMEVNLRINANGGYLKTAGVPCKGVKKATLTFKLNRSGTEYAATSDTEGVTVGSQTRTSGTSDWGKDYTEYSYPLTLNDGLTHFNFTITDSHASNHIYIADIKIVVTEVY